MKIVFGIFLFLGMLVAGEKINVVVSVIPQIYFVKKIGGDYVNVNAMVPDGRSPETYEPLPSEMKIIKKAQIYLGVGMEFEKIWSERFKGANPNLTIIDLSKGLNLREFTHSHDDSSHHHGKYDPHIWLSVALAKDEAKKICEALSKLDPLNASTYNANLQNFLKEINHIDESIKAIFAAPDAQKAFLVYHPAFGYLASEYGLDEIALEADGKSPKMKKMMALAQIVKQKNIQVVYIQPQFAKKRVLALANDLKLRVLELNPLAEDWEKNILYIAKTIATQGREK
ncbi:metal ABC transporter solute-binding protein, Zn/Mn family [Helicobacter cappadocius]|uniref:Zinc ABC transporter substrate-binding protein n=1 Tax=Helicobacter cappadocius TaxID=3063998 RepID=A0AA90TCA5_9HELI|nr:MULTISPECIES: zinc ABC transporter substrate-binding protein [unclassified Helicobacter]MDO7253643.1 zinc ABC transporter substrate-binding protein [Helicobacter sp. faydin-H75]MDP2539571.1 zinc ABC transporter substrate-binding protein [Helicobacter sp. faydin-H76]